MTITNRRHVDMGGPDFYPTPAWATYALTDHELFHGTIWEPACGDGAMSWILKKNTMCIVVSSDLYDRGYGNSRVDFLKAETISSNIVTNPPYHSAEAFVKKGLELATDKLALLLRLSFLESITRYNSIFSITPPSRVWVFSERITFYPKGAERKGSGTTAYAWFVWKKDCCGEPTLRWIPPGYKKKYGDK